MGLMDLTDEQIGKLKEMLKILTIYFGITEDDLRYLPEAIKKVKEGQMPNKKFEMSKTDKQNLEDKMKKIQTPEEFFEQFKGNIEEFYPNGKPKGTTNTGNN